MKKLLVIGIAVVMTLALGMALASAETTTLLVYLCGTDLQEDACEDIYEMADANTGDNVNIVVLAGGASEWSYDFLQRNTRNLFVIRDGDIEGDPENWGRESMGSADSLKEFLEYGLTEYPADRTIVILWDHGAGSEGGICFDETANDDSLTVAEINSVLAGLQSSVPDFHINIFGCDACMMATYELAAVLSHYNIDYFVASEELEPGTGWFYTGWLQMLDQDPGMSDADVCGAIIEDFFSEGLANDPDDYLTLSAVDLKVFSALEESMEDFAAVMSSEIEGGNIGTISRGRSRMYTFGSFDDASWDMVDLGAVLDAYATLDTAKATEAKRCLSRAVILSQQTDNLAVCSGLSILLPEDTAGDYGEYKAGLDVRGVIPNWVEFLDSYTEQLCGGSFHFNYTGASQICTEYDWDDYWGDYWDDGWFVSTYDMPGGCSVWDDEEECYTEEVTVSEAVDINAESQGFTSMIPTEELQYLDYVEGQLMMDMSDDDGVCFVDFGTMQNNLVDWNTGKVVSLYDGSWPMLGEQIVPLYDQSVNENSRRSLIPVKLNGEYTYLVVVFPANGTEGRVIGANAGYDENGLPIRNVTKLKDGDVIIPIYTMYYEEEGKDDLQETEFEGSQITWQDGMTVTYADISDDEDPMDVLFCFIFNDIFGEYTMSDLIAFQI